MGCDCTKSAHSLDSEAEEAVQLYEKALGYSHFPMEIVLKALRKPEESKIGLPLEALKCNLEQVGVPASGLDQENSPLGAFYHHFQDEEGQFSLQSLTLLTVLLSESPSKQKSEAIFSLFDTEASQALPSSSANEVIQELCDIALLYLPMYAEMETAAVGEEHALRKVKRYSSRLAQGYEALLGCLQALVVRGRVELTYEEFVDTVVTQAAYLFDPKELRARAVAARPNVPKPGEDRRASHMKSASANITEKPVSSRPN